MTVAATGAFDERAVLHDLRHYLPAQAPLKDFVHHNTLHAFQALPFDTALRTAAAWFGYRTTLDLEEYRRLHAAGRIRSDVLDRCIAEAGGDAAALRAALHTVKPAPAPPPRIGRLRTRWRDAAGINIDAMLQPLLFRLLGAYLDQGIASWRFPAHPDGLLASVRALERDSIASLFRTRTARAWLLEGDTSLEALLGRVVGEPAWFAQYLFDQQFAHPGWSGMVATLEHTPEALLEPRPVTLRDLVALELLLEIDAIEAHDGPAWAPLAGRVPEPPPPLFVPEPPTDRTTALAVWQAAYEWSYYDEVLAGLQAPRPAPAPGDRAFQALFCIDDRECSLRRHLEAVVPTCETYGTPGFFGVDCFYQPAGGRFATKVCPAPMTPGHLVRELHAAEPRPSDPNFARSTHALHSGALVANTLGVWAAVRLTFHLLRPAMSAAAASSHRHMDGTTPLTVEAADPPERMVLSGHELQVGYTVGEMADRVEGVLRGIGLVDGFAELVYVIGHGASSVNNPHYAAYDCGACSGRPGSVNARVFCHMANHPGVRARLAARGIAIPEATRFIGGLHDTTRDEVVFFDEVQLADGPAARHRAHVRGFAEALERNAKERSRRFASIDSRLPARRVHELVKRRSVSLFEPRPELNHATNAVCIVGRRPLTRGLFFDRRSFMQSYDCRLDPAGDVLLGILRAVAPVCGGISLEYFFSRTDNRMLGADSKLPHNVMGLIGVANGVDGDLRTGLPSQMIEVHEPLRLLLVVEHEPEVVRAVLERAPETAEWFTNRWIHLVAVHPETRAFAVFRDGAFVPYTPLRRSVDAVADLTPLIERADEALPVLTLG